MSAEATVQTVAAAAAAGGQQPLDEVMLAMDVVDTLRRRERIAKNELDDLGREEDLKERLRKIYAAQGIEVPDRVIEQGVAALKEERFTYKPPPPSLGIRLARLYIDRGRWGKWIGALVGVGILAAGVNYFVFVAPNAALPKDLARVHTEAVALARTDQAKETLERYFNTGQAALRNNDKDGAKLAIKELDTARAILGQEYTVRIVNRPKEQTGVWRIPNLNTGARNYYIIVEAVDPAGRVLTVPIQKKDKEKKGKEKMQKVDRMG